jgi:hypothetical protein
MAEATSTRVLVTGLPFWYTIMYNKDAGQCVARMIALEHRSPPK